MDSFLGVGPLVVVTTITHNAGSRTLKANVRAEGQHRHIRSCLLVFGLNGAEHTAQTMP